MTPTERRLLRLIKIKTARMEAGQRARWLRAVQYLQTQMPLSRLEDLIQSGRIAELLTEDVLNQAFAEFREGLYNTTVDSFRFSREQIQGAMLEGRPMIAFNTLSPRVMQAIGVLDERILSFKQEVRETVRVAVADGLQAGRSPLAVARTVRDVIGIAPNQVAYVRNLRLALESGDAAKAVSYDIDKRFVKMIEKGGLTQAKIDRIVESYTNRRIAQHANTVARTTTLQSYKQANRASYGAAIDAGIIKRHLAVKSWRTVGDSKVREEHDAMNGETVPFDANFSNGEELPGDSTYNCRCLPIYSEKDE